MAEAPTNAAHDDGLEKFLGSMQSKIATAVGDRMSARYDSGPRTGVLEVVTTSSVTPHMKRVRVRGDFLRDLDPSGVGDYGIRVVFPDSGDPLLTRSYTLRRVEIDAGEAEIDFALHEGHGVAATWAQSASPGDRIGGIVPPRREFRGGITHDHYLFVGDESALPAMSAIVESLPPQLRAVMIAEISDETEEQTIATQCDLVVEWLHRGTEPAGSTDLLERALERLQWPDGDVFVWAAGETKTVGRIRRFLRDERGLRHENYQVTPYWRRGMSWTEREKRAAELVGEAIAAGEGDLFTDNPIEDAVLILEGRD